MSPMVATPSVGLDQACAEIRDGLIGRNDPLDTPFGMKPLVYADWTASGRPVESIEAFIRQEVHPRYGNTHTTSSATGAQTTAFREEARRIIAESVNAKDEKKGDDDVVVFAGSGSTAAVAKILSALGLDKKPRRSWGRRNRPVVLIGPFEHHSNILPWRENNVDVVAIAEDVRGGLDLHDLEVKLKKYSSRKLKIGSFAAASNVTGAFEDTKTISRILHRAGALSFWDYATAAPYVAIDMNPEGSSAEEKALVAKDAVFVSGHKFLGGVGTPGLLICKEKLFRRKVPVVPGGGTVVFVTPTRHEYIRHIEEREEGGTPDIVGSIRLGLAFQMKERLGNVERREEQMTEMGLAVLRSNPRIFLLGDTGRSRLPIFSFLIRHGDRYLHHNFVCALLNDLFGVQARAGCACAGPYGFILLGMDDRNDTPKILDQLKANSSIIRPGFCRLSLTFFNSEEEAKYILESVMFVADHGPSFLPLYHANIMTGEWTSIVCPVSVHNCAAARRTLAEADYGFSEEADFVPPQTPTKVAAAAAWKTSAAGGEAAMFAKLKAEALHLASNVASMFAPVSKMPIIAESGAASYEETATIVDFGESLRKQPAEFGVTSATVRLSERLSRVGLRLSDAPAPAGSTLNKEGESMRWFYLPSEDPSLPSLSSLQQPVSSIIKPKLYKRE